MTFSLLTGLLMVVGLVGIVVPVLPGLVLVFLSTAFWAWAHPEPSAWIVFWIAGAIYLAGVGLQYVVPGRRMRRAGVGTPTLLLAVALALVGFFVVPVVGAAVGFVLGIYLVEYVRKRDPAVAWLATKSALVAVLHSMGIELTAGFAIVATWVAGLVIVGSGS